MNTWSEYISTLSDEKKYNLAKVNIIALTNIRWDLPNDRFAKVIAKFSEEVDEHLPEELQLQASHELDIWNIKEDGSMVDMMLNLFDDVFPRRSEDIPMTERYRKELKSSLKKGAQHAVQSETESA